MKMKIQNRLCIDCSGELVKTREGNVVCSNCGLTFLENSKNLLSEQTVLIENNSFIPTIPLGGKIKNTQGIFKDASRKPINIKYQETFHYLKKLDEKLKTFQASITIHNQLLTTMIQICLKLNLSKQSMINILILYLKALKFFKKNTCYKFTSPTILAACLLIILRLQGESKIINLLEITDLFIKHGHRVVKSKIAWCASIINKKLIANPITYINLVKLYIERFVKILALNEEINLKLKKRNLTMKIDYYMHLIQIKAFEILNKIKSYEMQGKNPFVIASSLIYVAEKSLAQKILIKPILSIRSISRICNVPEFSIREHIPFLLKFIKNGI